jgi:hypothetical protein
MVHRVTPKISTREAHANGVGFTVHNESGQPAFSVICQNMEMHDLKLDAFKRVLAGANVVFAPTKRKQAG